MPKAPQIVLKTRIADGIYRSAGGGQTITASRRPVTARGLVNAVQELVKEEMGNRLVFGNVGCGRSWLEVGGREVDSFDVGYVSGRYGGTKTSRAQRVLDDMLGEGWEA